MLMFISLFFLGLITSFVGTNTGGSSLVTIPAMIAMGLPPQIAIASARVTSIGTLFAGLRQIVKTGHRRARVVGTLNVMSAVTVSAGRLIQLSYFVSA